MRNPCELLLQWLYVVRVDVGITESVDELTSLQSTDLGKHAGQKCVARDVEGDTEAQVARTLIHLAAELVVGGDVELGQDVARRKRHLGEGRWIPSGHQNPTTGWITFQLIDNGLKLVNSLSLVVVMHRTVLSSEVAPLEAIDWAKVPLLAISQAPAVEELTRRIAVPNSDLHIA